jgi:hypothetical protein
MQAHEILEDTDASDLQAYADEMFARAWPGQEKPGSGPAPSWATTSFCDGVAALVLRPEREGGSDIVVRDFASVSRPYSPEDASLDPGAWASEALDALPDGDREFDVVEVAGPTPAAEARALDALAPRPAVGRSGFNRRGGGATANFGAATGLRQIAEASRSMAAGAGPASGLVLDMAGPIGQHATAIVLQRGGDA